MMTIALRGAASLMAVIALSVFAPVLHAAPPAKTTPALQAVEYTALEDRVGERVVIETTFNTTRSGILRKYTSVVLTIELDGGIELTVPREGIRRISLAGAAASLETSAAGDAGAQKN